MSSMGLEQLPADLGSNLISLDLSINNISHISAEIGKLTKLSQLLLWYAEIVMFENVLFIVGTTLLLL